MQVDRSGLVHGDCMKELTNEADRYMQGISQMNPL